MADDVTFQGTTPSSQHVGAGVMMMSAVASGGLPSTGTATTLAVATQRGAHVFGFSSRSLMA